MAPRPLFSRLSWNLFQKSVHSAHRVAVLLDYDGTLTPIRKKPSQATLDSSMRRLLRKLSQRKDLHVGVVTGRSLNNIDQLLRNKALFLVANHGFQVGFRGKTWTHPAARNDAPLLHTIYSQLKRELRDVAAILVEDKVFTLTVHYRNVHKTALPRIRNVIQKILALHQKKLRVTRGKKVIELRPALSWGKGNGVERVLRSIGDLSHTALIFIGDDATDEDVFRVLGPRAFTIRVGFNRDSKARYFVRNVASVRKVLESIVSLRKKK